MALRRFKYDDDGTRKAGTWARVIRNGKSIAQIVCHNCDLAGTLDPGHYTINAAGEISPSVVCGCGYHEFIELEGWPLAGQ